MNKAKLKNTFQGMFEGVLFILRKSVQKVCKNKEVQTIYKIISENDKNIHKKSLNFGISLV